MMGKCFGPRQRGGRCRRKPVQLCFEAMESRLLLATMFTVTDVSDDVNDTGSLRYAITQSNLTGPGPNTINFNIPGMGVKTIAPSTALPAITAPVIIDGTSQPGYNPNNPTPMIELSGLNLTDPGEFGLLIFAGNSTVKGLVIDQFTGSGIVLFGSNATSNLVQGNYIGTDLSGTKAVPNVSDGVEIIDASNNTIGGTTAATRNVISGNGASGILISTFQGSATGNVVEGNYIGTDVTGNQAVANSLTGIYISQQASNNLIGGTTATARNLISGNGGDGIEITDSASSNRVQGNYIGTNADGNGHLSNFEDGVTIIDAPGNLIGGTDPGMGNLITGNGMNGVNIFSSTDGTNTTGNVVQGNLIGTDASGKAAIGNLNSGVVIANAMDNVIGGTTPDAGNIISGNGQDGLFVALAATGNLIQGNEIGTDVTGTKALANFSDGVFIEGSSGNTIGGTTPGARNVISANHLSGIHMLGGETGNQIQGNLVGTDVTGTRTMPNVTNGVFIEQSSSDTIGGTTPGARNIISGNHGDGVMIVVCTAIVVQGNYIGLDRSGTQPLDNSGNGVTVNGSTDVTIGGTETGAGNVIARSEKDGISIEFGTTGTLVQGNIIGLDYTGTVFLSNFGNGVSVANSSETTIGGMTTAARNIISANGGDGIKISNFSADNVVQGNFIGTDVSGSVHMANLGNGVEVTTLSVNTTIGGETTAARNIISGNQGSGIVLSLGSGMGNVVQGNFIGTDVSGTQALGNTLYGVLISQSTANVIGGATPSTSNVISDNHLAGIFILGNRATGNVVQGNLIGTDVTGTQALGNHQEGVSIGSSTTNNTIGGTVLAARNLISGNLTNGITIAGQGTSGNTVQGNYIGTDISGMHPLRNFLSGVFVQDASNNTIGGDTASASNLISGNGQDGVLITNSSATGNLIQSNLIGTDVTGTRVVDAGGNPLGNGGNGISIIAAPLNTIGGQTTPARNLISGNSQNGISIANLPASPGQGITIVGNIIGSDAMGILSLGNQADGIVLDNVTNDVIGGLSSSDRNLIAASGVAGVEIRGGNSISNLVQGNFIGTDTSGEASLANLVGVFINGAKNNTIGGTDPGAGNLISGNSNAAGSGVGVQILGFGATGNLVQGNLIGTDATGTLPRGNDTGVFINDVAGNTIGGTANGARNVISGNTSTGIQLLGQGAGNNVVEGNFIGTDINGTRTLLTSRPDLGILVNNTPGTDVIGGTTAAARNVVSGFKVGIEVFASQSQFNPTAGTAIEGNYIGTGQTGEAVLGNDVGVFINGVPLNMIGGTTPGARNVISGNTVGIQLLGATATRNLIQGNFIGLGSDGKKPLGNHIGIFLDAASSNTIGGTTPGAGNVIAGNVVVNQEGSTGIYLFDGASNNTMVGNLIGTDASGRPGRDLAQGNYGVLLFNASNNPIAKSLGTNRVVGSGIANLREFTGPVTQSRSGRGRKPVRYHPHRPAPAGPRKLLGFSRLAGRPFVRAK